MAADRPTNIALPPPLRDERPTSPRPGIAGLRSRPPPSRSAASAAGITPLNRRRSSLFSDNFSETQRSLKTSTDDLLLPRVNEQSTFDHDTSHWHSVPLGLALLPAVGGLFFQNGSAIITDLSLLVLAAVFLNWSVRLPWDWYASAQATRTSDPYSPPAFGTVVEEYNETIDEGIEDNEAITSSPDATPPRKDGDKMRRRDHNEMVAAQRELHVHELLALSSCFLGPAVGAWLLHAIRSQLSRPSEGLVSNYNLTVFLLAAELRPMSHLIKMVQARTLFLQRIVREKSAPTEEKLDNRQVLDLVRRLEELETHVADKADSANQNIAANADMTVAKASAQATTDLRRSIQPELDALNRAVRRYEKRTTISALQTESRLQEIEARLKDAMVLTAAVQRNADRRPKNHALTLVNWASAVVVVPVQYVVWVLGLPSKAFQQAKDRVGGYLGLRKSNITREQRSMKQPAAARSRERKQKSWT